MGALEILLNLAFSPLGLIFAVGLMAWRAFGGMLSRPKNQLWLAEQAEVEDWRVFYRQNLTKTLNWLDQFWAPNHLADNRPPTSPARAWNWRLYNFCLLLAVAYPLLSVIVVWAITGEAGRIGALEIILADDNDWRRAGVATLLAAQIAVMIYACRTSGWQRLVDDSVAMAMALAGASALVNALVLAGTSVGIYITAAVSIVAFVVIVARQ